MAICVYCGKEKPMEELSQEHVIPRAIGGNLRPTNPFSLNSVCERCNNLCGAYIDGPFIKNWLTHNNRVDAIRKYADISKSPILPLTYIGLCDDVEFEDNVCELWLGPTGDTIYHFHKPYPEEPDVSPMVGVPTFTRESDIDPGFSFLFLRSNNPLWHPTIVKSFASQFEDSVLFLGNGSTPRGGRFSDIPPELHDLHLLLQNMSGQRHKALTKTNIHYGDRFLAKLALGIGALMLNEEFLLSDSAELLRAFMWTKDADKRGEMRLHGAGFFSGVNDGLKKIMSWPGCHVIALIQTGRSVNLYTSFYETQNAVIRISSEPQHWAGKVNEGLVFIISPGMQKFVGPKNIGAYIAHKCDPCIEDPDIANLEEEMNNVKDWPPFDI